MDRAVQEPPAAVMADTVIARALAPAKVNLGLDIFGKRSDGFHEICTIMQTVTIFDHIAITSPGSGKLISNAIGLDPELNFVCVAAGHLADAFGRQLDVDFQLQKRIPVAAGLGGGSSDAASTIRLLVRHWGIAAGDPRVAHVAETTGSDVPFFLTGGRALVEGKGERVQGISDLRPFWIVVIVPPLDIPEKTATLYSALAPSDFSDGSAVRALASATHVGAGPFPNCFARSLYELCPDLESFRAEIASIGYSNISLSGAGPAHYLVADELAEAVRILWLLRSSTGLRDYTIHLARSLSGPGPISAQGNPTLP